MFGGNIHDALIHAATRYDMREEAKAAKKRNGRHNVYALGQILSRIAEVEKDYENGTPIRAALTAAFNGPLLNCLLVAVGETRVSTDERLNQSPIYRPN